MPTSAVRRRRWTRADYDRVIEVGGFGPEDRIELLDGELWEVTPQGARHAAVCAVIAEVVRKAFGEDFHVRSHSPIALDDLSEPEPDLAVVSGGARDYLDEHPLRPLLVVEVSKTSLSFDRGRKLAAYARNGIAEYWIVDITAETIEVHREPADGTYATVSVLRRGETVAPLNAPSACVEVSDILP